MSLAHDLTSKVKPYLNRRFVKQHWPVFYLALFLFGRHLIAFLFGFHPAFIELFPIGIVFWILGFVFSAICLFVTIIRALKRQSFVRFLIVWVFIAIFNFLPGIFPSAAGALTSLLLAGPKQVVEEGRILLENYQPPENVDCDFSFPPCGQTTDYPPAIQRLNPVYMRVAPDFVLIKKFGIGDIAGFVIYPSGSNPEGIELIDGLYWIDAW